MGSCVTKEFLPRAHKEGGTAPLPDQPSATPQEGNNPPLPPPKEGHNENSFQGSSGTTSRTNMSSSRAYNVTALATSSLVGLIQTIKDHITKPTAMAQGRVAHLIEWKGWSAPQKGWGQAPPEEALYEELSDELKEARFAAGVAEQFAVTEATLSVWSSLDEEELGYRGGSQGVIQLQDLEGLYLQENLLFYPPTVAGSLHASSLSTPVPNRPSKANNLGRREGEEGGPPSSLGLQQSATSLRYVDSSSPSEDEVFYD